MKKYQCIYCKNKLKCACFDIDLDEYHSPFCSAKCVIKFSNKYEEYDIVESQGNIDFDFRDKKGYYALGYNGHFNMCENQFDVKNRELKKLIKSLQDEFKIYQEICTRKSIELNKLKNQKNEK